MPIAGVIFDGDDTLWDTMPLYTDAKQQFFERMGGLGFSRQEVEQCFEEIDVRNVEQFGFSRNRFPSSMVQAYRELCQRHGQRVEPALESNYKQIGEEVFERPVTVFSEAKDVLSMLGREFLLVLATKGDSDIQLRRIEQSGLAQHFHYAYVLPQKAPADYTRIVSEQNLSLDASWSVGNSIRSDINPAIEIGLSGMDSSHNVGLRIGNADEIYESVQM